MDVSFRSHMRKFARTLKLPHATFSLAAQMSNRAVLLAEKQRNPRVLSAVAIYLAANLQGERMKQKVLSDACGVSQVTIRKVYRELATDWEQLAPANYEPIVRIRGAYLSTNLSSKGAPTKRARQMKRMHAATAQAEAAAAAAAAAAASSDARGGETWAMAIASSVSMAGGMRRSKTLPAGIAASLGEQDYRQHQDGNDAAQQNSVIMVTRRPVRSAACTAFVGVYDASGRQVSPAAFMSAQFCSPTLPDSVVHTDAITTQSAASSFQAAALALRKQQEQQEAVSSAPCRPVLQRSLLFSQ
jgi:hypothetical protein